MRSSAGALRGLERQPLVRDEPHDHREPVGVHEEQVALRIVGRAAPVHAARVAREHDGAPQARRREDALGARGRDLLATPRAILLGGAPGVVGAEAFGRDRDAGGTAASATPSSPGTSLGGTGRSSTGKQRRAGHAVEDEDAAHLRGDRDRGGAVAPGEERGLGRDVVVPEIVVDDLEAPHQLAGGGAQGDDGVRPPVVARARAAPVVGARAAGRDEHQPALRDRRTGSTTRCRLRCAASSGLAHGIGSQVQRSAPVRASKARTMPRSTSTARLSPIDDPTTTTSPAIAGAEVTW